MCKSEITVLHTTKQGAESSERTLFLRDKCHDKNSISCASSMFSLLHTDQDWSPRPACLIPDDFVSIITSYCISKIFLLVFIF